MDEQAIRSRSDDPREEALRMATPLRMAWHKIYFDLPLAMWSEAMRFAGQGLQAQGEFFSGLRMCRSVPDMIETQSTFMRAAVNDYGAETNSIASDVRSTVNRTD